jgi:hypothetical protein
MRRSIIGQRGGAAVGIICRSHNCFSPARSPSTSASMFACRPLELAFASDVPRKCPLVPYLFGLDATGSRVGERLSQRFTHDAKTRRREESGSSFSRCLGPRDGMPTPV